MGMVDALLSKYRGREHSVYAKVCSKYGLTAKPEWTPPSTAKKKKTKQKATRIEQPQSKMKKKRSVLKNKTAVTNFVSKIQRQTLKPQTQSKAKVEPSKKKEQQSEGDGESEDDDAYDDDFEVELKHSANPTDFDSADF